MSALTNHQHQLTTTTNNNDKTHNNINNNNDKNGTLTNDPRDGRQES